jgi:hypothetical protein
MEAAQGDANVGWELAHDARRERGRRFGTFYEIQQGERAAGSQRGNMLASQTFRTRVRVATREVRWFPMRLG